jgi:hypothetical protein
MVENDQNLSKDLENTWSPSALNHFLSVKSDIQAHTWGFVVIIKIPSSAM